MTVRRSTVRAPTLTGPAGAWATTAAGVATAGAGSCRGAGAGAAGGAGAVRRLPGNSIPAGSDVALPSIGGGSERVGTFVEGAAEDGGANWGAILGVAPAAAASAGGPDWPSASTSGAGTTGSSQMAGRTDSMASATP